MMLLVGFLLFSLIQIENMLWAMQISFYMTSVFAILSFYFMQKSINAGDKEWRFLSASIVCAFISSFSSMHGLIIWLVVSFLYLLHFRLKAFKSVRFWLWNAFALLTFVLFFIDFQFNPHHPGFIDAVKTPVRLALYFLVAIGRSLSVELYQNPFYGLLITAFSAYMLYSFIKNNNKYDFLPLALAAFGIIFSLLIALGRVNLGVEQATVSRYTTYSLCIVIGICLYLFNGRMDKWSNRTIIAVIVVLFLGTQATYFQVIRIQSEIHKQKQQYFIDFRHSNDLELTFSDLTREFAVIFERQGVGPFKGLEPKVVSLDAMISGSVLNDTDEVYFNLDAINDISPDESIAINRRFIPFYGWAFDKKADRPFDNIVVNINGNSSDFRFVEREDIYGEFEGEISLESGFIAFIDRDHFRVGENSLEFYLINNQDGVFYKRTLLVEIESILLDLYY